MCHSDCSLRFIAASCFVVIATDVYVLSQIISRGNYMRASMTFDEYERCFRPQF